MEDEALVIENENLAIDKEKINVNPRRLPPANGNFLQISLTFLYYFLFLFLVLVFIRAEFGNFQLSVSQLFFNVLSTIFSIEGIVYFLIPIILTIVTHKSFVYGFLFGSASLLIPLGIAYFILRQEDFGYFMFGAMVGFYILPVLCGLGFFGRIYFSVEKKWLKILLFLAPYLLLPLLLWIAMPYL
ncbi:MAG: hypothetical protein ACI83O_000223 [Patescibacteria group bacterium]|jgi:hypothetical protein